MRMRHIISGILFISYGYITYQDLPQSIPSIVIEEVKEVKVPYYTPDFKIPKEVRLLVEDINSNFNIPDSIIYRQIFKESSFRKNAVSSCNAKGYMQITAITYLDIRNRIGNNYDINNERDNIYMGIWYLDHLYKRIQKKNMYSDVDEWRMTLASYNAGYSVASKALVEYKETRDYVNFILNING